MFGKSEDRLELLERIEKLRLQVEKLSARIKTKDEETEDRKSIDDLKKELTELRISKAEVEAEHARERRDIEHHVGLEKKRMEQEIELAKRDVELTVREEALDAKIELLTEKFTGIEERLVAEVKYLKDDVLKVVIERLPTVTVDRNINETIKPATTPRARTKK